MSLLPPSDSHLRRSTHLPWISSVHGCSSFSLAFHPIPPSVHPISNGLHIFTGGLHTHHHHGNVAPPNPNPKEKKLPSATSSLDPGDLPERIPLAPANIRRLVCGEGFHPVRFASLPLLTYRLTRTSRGCVARIDPLLPNPPFFAPFARIPGWGKQRSTRSKRDHKKGLGRRFGLHPDPVQPSPTQTRQVETRQTSASHRFETFRFGFERCSASLQGTPAAFGPEGGAGGGLVGRTGPPTSPATVAPLVQLDTHTHKKKKTWEPIKAAWTPIWEAGDPGGPFVDWDPHTERRSHRWKPLLATGPPHGSCDLYVPWIPAEKCDIRMLRTAKNHKRYQPS